MRRKFATIQLLLTSLLSIASPALAGEVSGWLSWRGPNQSGTSAEIGVVDKFAPGGDGELWTFDIAGRGTPVIAGGRVFTIGYEGEGKDLQEVLLCLDELGGGKIWEHRFSDFLSDTIYDRYAIASPTIDGATGNVFCLSTAGLLSAFSRDGRLLWQRSMMSEFGRLTFPNGRTGAPIIDDDRVIIHVITAHWGPKHGPARDRFFAFDKQTGELIWSCTPGIGPKDSSFSMPLMAYEKGRRVLYAGTGCGNVVCIDARTGEPLWRFPMATGGVNSAVLRRGDQVIAIHGKENLDTSTIGRMVAIQTGIHPQAGAEGPVVLDRSAELWRNDDLVAFTSSPVLVADRIYQTTANGDLNCIDATTGKRLWHEKLAPDQIHASPLHADGKLYVPMNNGSFHVLRPDDNGPNVIQTVQLEGNCLGAPALLNGRIYVHTTRRLYCFGSNEPEIENLTIARLQVIPADILLRQGQRAPIRVRGLRQDGSTAIERVDGVEWSKKGPAGVQFIADEIIAAPEARPGIAWVTATRNGVSGPMRVRVVNSLPFTEDFESFTPQAPAGGEGVPVANPPSHWIGAAKKFDVRELDGSKVLVKTLDNNLFQRATILFGQPDMSDYTVQVDIRTDGNRRTMSTAGILNQRYMIQLKGNHQEIEISSNMERIKESVRFRWKPDQWYTLKTRVDVAADGSGVVRAKAWQRDAAEPDAWNIEVEHRNAHRNGSPGLFGFSPQSRFHVYMDNLKVLPND